MIAKALSLEAVQTFATRKLGEDAFDFCLAMGETRFVEMLNLHRTGCRRRWVLFLPSSLLVPK